MSIHYIPTRKNKGVNQMLEFYKKHILPWKRRAEHAEAMCKTQSEIIKKLAAKV